MSKKVFVLGGTGFLGYYTTKELLKRGYQVVTAKITSITRRRLIAWLKWKSH